MHLEYDTEPLKLTQCTIMGIVLVYNIWVRIPTPAPRAGERRHGPRTGLWLGQDVDTRTWIAHQVDCIHQLHVSVWSRRWPTGFPNRLNNKRIDLTNRVEIAMIQTIGNSLSIPLRLRTMFQDDESFMILHIRRDINPGIMQRFASMIVGTVFTRDRQTSVLKKRFRFRVMRVREYIISYGQYQSSSYLLPLSSCNHYTSKEKKHVNWYQEWYQTCMQKSIILILTNRTG